MTIPDPATLWTIFLASLTAMCLAFVLLGRFLRPDPLQPSLAGAIRLVFDGRDLIDSTPGAIAHLDLPADGHDAWDRAADSLGGRFPGLAGLDPASVTDALHLTPAEADDPAELTLEPGRGWLTLILCDPASDPALRTELRHLRDELTNVRIALDEAPYPIWQTGASGRIVWANETYRQLARHLARQPELSDPIPEILPLPEEAPSPLRPVRVQIATPDGGRPLWYDVTSVEQNQSRLHYAVDMNASVQAEIAQRNFIQALAKTFAQLSVGLAVFDRRQRLALFNPALVDLTALSAEFLSRQPDLSTFFDRLRDARIMPEPKDYAAWRRRISALVTEASADEHTEVWTLPSGLTYRLSGRPHPDGAVAFLIEDISAEVAMTRRYRSELELSQSVVDALDEAVVVFSRLGTQTLCNRAYRDLWSIGPEDGVTEITVAEASELWRKHGGPANAIAELRGAVASFDNSEPRHIALTLLDGDRLRCRSHPLSGGATLIGFRRRQGTGKAQARLNGSGRMASV